jgi:hypothetical protein
MKYCQVKYTRSLALKATNVFLRNIFVFVEKSLNLNIVIYESQRDEEKGGEARYIRFGNCEFF